MTREERNPDYFEGKPWSRFHRATQPATASMIDIDDRYTRFCKRCGKTLVLVEDTKDLSHLKPATAIRQLALDAGVPAWRVYVEGDPHHPRWLHVQQVAPTGSAMVRVTPEAVTKRLARFQAEHDLICELYETTHGAPTDEPPAPQPADTDPDAEPDFSRLPPDAKYDALPITACPGCGSKSSENYDGHGSCWICAKHPKAVS